MGKIQIGGILQSRDLALIQVPGLARPGAAASLLRALGERGISAQLVVQCRETGGPYTLAFVVAGACQEEARAAVEGPAHHAGAREVAVTSPVGMVAVFGPHFRDRPAIAGTMLAALDAAGIEVLAVSTSISTVACVVRASEMDRAVG
ncbi:MAG: ACT domain-containing protein, partial [Chloroflexia bacterium]